MPSLSFVKVKLLKKKKKNPNYPTYCSSRANLLYRIECELPETPDRFQDNGYFWPENSATVIPCLEDRLNSLERGMGEMTRMMRQMVDRSSFGTSCGTGSQLSKSLYDEPLAGEGQPALSTWPPLSLPKPIRLIRDLQSEFFGKPDHPSADTLMGDVATREIADSKLSQKLIQLYIPYLSIYLPIYCLDY